MSLIGWASSGTPKNENEIAFREKCRKAVKSLFSSNYVSSVCIYEMDAQAANEKIFGNIICNI